jgi:UDP:flavonoid glycosyltransferase YjiC (YdhE family)
MRLEAIRAGIYLSQRKRTPKGLVAALREVTLSEIAPRAAEIGETLRKENGPARTCQILEKSFTAKLRPEDAVIYGFIDAVNSVF